MSDTKPHALKTTCQLFKILPLALLLAACGEKYSPDTYKSSAVQQANKVETGVVVGVRMVKISADPTVASATGATAGGIAGSQVSEGAYSALSALGGAVVGGLAGNEAGHKIQDTYGYEYIVRNAKGELLSVTQKDTSPLKVGQRVLLIQGSQARIVNDYTEEVDTDFAAGDTSGSASDGDMQGGQAKPAKLSDREELMNAAAAAAAAAAVAAITAESLKDKDGDTSNKAKTQVETQVETQDELPATTPEEAAGAGDDAGAPMDILPKSDEEPTPAPPSTIIVPEPTEMTKPGTTTGAPGTAPAIGTGGHPTKVTPVKDAAQVKEEAEAEAEADSSATTEAEPEAGQPATAGSEKDKPAVAGSEKDKSGAGAAQQVAQ